MPLRPLPLQRPGRLPALMSARMPTRLHAWTPALLLAATGLAACSSPPPPPARAAAPLTLAHDAVPVALPAADPASLPWRDANTLVERLKGHAGHLRNPPDSPVPDKALPRRPAASETR